MPEETCPVFTSPRRSKQPLVRQNLGDGAPDPSRGFGSRVASWQGQTYFLRREAEPVRRTAAFSSAFELGLFAELLAMQEHEVAAGFEMHTTWRSVEDQMLSH